ncbi:unnamed protein product [Staurois parvus]|uniref:Uncharacterized protein n=1 Tax=Staurois parvus TaxID=386267 RepID=A0ABN9GRP8_9NEOB|nr:unnamed protein product [Staurois parvus]
MEPPTDPGPSGSARVSKWSVRPCCASIMIWGCFSYYGHSFQIFLSAGEQQGEVSS